MNLQHREYFRKILNDQLNALMNAGGKTLSVIMEQGDGCPDPADQATFDENRDVMLHIRSRESRLIKRIRAALERIDDGTFGICEICEEKISIQRLNARPVTTQCIACKTRSEALEKKNYG